MSTTSGGESIELGNMEQDTEIKIKDAQVMAMGPGTAGGTTEQNAIGGAVEKDAAGGTTEKVASPKRKVESTSIGTPEQCASPTRFKHISYFAIPKRLTENQEKTLGDVSPLLDPKSGFQRRESFKKKLGKSEDKNVRCELLRNAVNTRNKKIIIDVLIFIQDCLSKTKTEVELQQSTKNIEEEIKQRNSLTLETTTGDLEPIETIEEACLRVIILLTNNNDIENLEEVLTWTKTQEICFNKLPSYKVCYPLQIASNKGYTFCLRILYNHGFKIEIDPVDRKNIKTLMKDDWRTGCELKTIRFLKFFDVCSGNFIHEDITWNRFIAPGKCKLDPVQRFMTLSAFANPAYTSIAYKEKHRSAKNNMSELDPLRTAFACATYTKYLAKNKPQYSKQYENIAHQCQEFATEILDQCECNEEVDTLLEHMVQEEPCIEKEDEPDAICYSSTSSAECWPQTSYYEENKNWNVSLWEEHKSFVSHHYFQEFINRKMQPQWSKNGCCYNSTLLTFTFAIMFFLCYPLVTILDLFRKANILFLNPSHISNESAFFRFFRKRIHQPMYRIIVDATFEVLFLVNLMLVIWDPGNTIGKPSLEWYDYTFIYMVITHLADDVVDILRHPYSSFWKIYSFLTHLCFSIGFTLQFVGFVFKKTNDKALMSGNDPAMIGTAMVSVASTAAVYRTVRWLQLFKLSGPVVIGLTKLVKDVFVVLILLVIVFTAFLLGIFSMFHIYDDRNNLNYTLDSQHKDLTSVWSAMPSMIWGILDPDSISMIKRNQTNAKDVNSTTEMVDSWEFYHMMAILMCMVYHFFVVIILTNVLITLMSATYSKISVNADIYWKFSKTFKLTGYLSPRATFPQPFRPIYYLAKLVYYSKTHPKKDDDINTDKKAYYDLLIQLVTRRDHSKDEALKEDQFFDLRKDITNLIGDKEQNDLPNQIIKMEEVAEKLNKIEENVTKSTLQVNKRINEMQQILNTILLKMDNLQKNQDINV